MPVIKAVIFDLDGTLVRYHGVEFESSWGAIAAAAGKQADSERLLAEFLPRRDAYSEWVAQDALLLAGLPVDEVARKIFPPPYAAGAREAVEQLRGRYRLGILSSGVDLVADYVRDDLGLDFAMANHLEIADGRFTGASETRVDLWHKADVLRRIATAEDVGLSEICFVGDHLNDVPVMQLVGLAIAFNPKDATLEHAAAYVTDDLARVPDLIAASRSA
jgi:phosphoserine phosphatase